MRFVHPIARFLSPTIRAFFRIVTLDPDKMRKNVKPALDPNCMVECMKDLIQKKILKKISRQQKETQITKHAKINNK